jgi:hypothetical protein
MSLADDLTHRDTFEGTGWTLTPCPLPQPSVPPPADQTGLRAGSRVDQTQLWGTFELQGPVGQRLIDPARHAELLAQSIEAYGAIWKALARMSWGFLSINSLGWSVRVSPRQFYFLRTTCWAITQGTKTGDFGLAAGVALHPHSATSFWKKSFSKALCTYMVKVFVLFIGISSSPTPTGWPGR